MNKYDLSEKHLRIAEILNELFDIPVDWDFDNTQVDADAIRAFQIKYIQLTKEISSLSDLADAMVVITSLCAQNNVDSFPEFPLQSLGKYILLSDLNNLLIKIQDELYVNRSGISEDKVRDYLPIFWAQEYGILLKCHLNQQSARITVNRLKRKVNKTIDNLVSRRVVARSKLGRTLVSSTRMASAPLTSKTRDQYVNEPRLVRLKDRTVGLCTLWADLLPLFTGGGLEIARFMSTFLGATAAAILPSDTK